MSETNTLASTSTSVTATGNETVTLAEEVTKYDTEKLISFLREQDLGIIKDDFDIIENERINGRLSQYDQARFRDYGMKRGPATRLADFAKEC
jgi:hypothetical protein